jgi:hypothetical protein
MYVPFWAVDSEMTGRQTPGFLYACRQLVALFAKKAEYQKYQRKAIPQAVQLYAKGGVAGQNTSGISRKTSPKAVSMKKVRGSPDSNIVDLRKY